jgi:uncharacterized protein YkwD
MSKKIALIGVILISLVSGIVYAQSQLTAFVTTSTATNVEIKREGTEDWVPINVESVIGVGDTIRTTDNGSATIRFLGENSYVSLKANTVIYIDRLTVMNEGYNIGYTILQGNTDQLLTSPTDKPATYEVVTANASLVTRGGQFAVWTDDAGNTDVLSQAGAVYTTANEQLIEIPPENGLRANSDGTLTNITPAKRREELQAALDGIPARFSFDGDVMLNVRQGPSKGTSSLGSIAPNDVKSVMGISEDGTWYRIRNDASFGWVSAQSMDVSVDTTFLTTYPATHVEILGEAQTEIVVATDENSAPAPIAMASTADILNKYKSEELTIIAQINQWRVTEGFWPLHLNDTLTTMAQDQAKYLLSLSQWPDDPHADSHGRNPRQRALDPKYQWPFYGMKDRTAIGEIAYVGVSPEVALNYWWGSQIHHDTAMNQGYREVGVAAVPHRLGSIYVVVVGARPDVFPAMIDPNKQVLYLSSERYRYADGGDWLINIQQVQILPSVLGQLSDSSWNTWGATLTNPGLSEFAVAYRGDNDHLVISAVNMTQDIAWLPDNLPSENAIQAQVIPTATPTMNIPVVNFEPVVVGDNSAPATTIRPGIFPTNTPYFR